MIFQNSKIQDNSLDKDVDDFFHQMNAQGAIVAVALKTGVGNH